MPDVRANFEFRLDADTSGPVFDGRAERAIDDLCHESASKAGTEGVRILRAEFDRVLQHQTPYYVTRVKSHDRGNESVIDDGRIVYGPWLEGTGSRNYPVTRFRGYKTFQRMFRPISIRAKAVVQELLDSKYLRRMN
jgi:hypothetical protein